MQETTLPPGFISIDEAISLIESDTRKNAVVDTAFLLRNLPYLRKDGNYNIKLLTRNSDGKIVTNGSKFVQIETEWDKSRLEHAIVDHYKKVTGRNVEPEKIGLRSMTTTVDEDTNPAGRVIANKKPMTKYGDPTSGGSREVVE